MGAGMEFLGARSDLSIAGRGRLRAKAVVPWRSLLAACLVSLLVGVALFEGPNAEHAAPLRGARHQLPSHEGLSTLPLAAQGVVSGALGADSAGYRISASGVGFQAQNAAQRLHMRFRSSGVQVASGDTHVGLSLRAVGYGTSLEAVGAARLSAKANRVTYTRPGLSEWYANGPLGLEQGFTISRAPAGHPRGTVHALDRAVGQRARLAGVGRAERHVDALAGPRFAIAGSSRPMREAAPCAAGFS